MSVTFESLIAIEHPETLFDLHPHAPAVHDESRRVVQDDRPW